MFDQAIHLWQHIDGTITSNVLKLLHTEKPVTHSLLDSVLELTCSEMLIDFGAGIIGKPFPVHRRHLVALAVWIGGIVLRDLKSMLRTQSN